MSALDTQTSRSKSQLRGGATPPPSPALGGLRARIAAERVRAEAIRRMPTTSERPSLPEMPMVPIFQMPLPEAEALTSDRDVTKREERIRNLLNERGALRLLGALANQELADSLASLYQSHPNFSAATDYVLGEAALARQKGGALVGLRILLTGPAGVGKTDYALRLSRLLGLPSQVISMSNAQSSAAIGGSETYWSNTAPGLVFQGLVQGDYSNQLFSLDELEKCATTWGDPAGALYQLLEDKTASVFRDKSVPWLEVDCSRVNWIATVNHAELLHEAIRSRFTEIAVTAPPEGQQRLLVQRLYGALLAEFALADRFPIHLSQSSEDVLVATSVREAKRMLRAALAWALRNNAAEIVVPAEMTATTNQRIGFV